MSLRELLEDLESLKETFIWSGDGSESEEPTTVVVPQSREVFQQQEMTVLDKFFSLRYGLAQKEATRLMGYSELSNSDGLGRRSTKTPTNLPEQRGMRITQFRNPSARSRELNQSVEVNRGLHYEEVHEQLFELERRGELLANQDAGAPYSSRTGFSQNIVVQPNSSSQQLVIVVDDTNVTNVNSSESDHINVHKKQSDVWTLDREYGISRDVLEQHSSQKLGDVAKILKAVPTAVSRSTLKRICRKNGIFRWPPGKAKTSKHGLTEQEFLQTTQGNVKESTQRNKPLYNPAQEKYSASNVQTTTNAGEALDDSSIMVKATYKDDIIKFRFPVSSGKLDLEKEIAMRLKLSVGSFKIEYLDEDDEWILIACDTDIETCVSTLKSPGKTTIKILVS
ncbi:hypothetical protein M9H77_13902 [Catharanthus roseus]|uniref:Uncharacterized protein n=1 Tax=Catharanthus roseus TaxID=4058 RepID=A0ACC0BLP8_CATRO|nr:hypothetical protein M9H77_13902 [Catharanthus roseus]